MGKFALASRLADELGTSVSKASRFVDEVGAPAARNTIDEAAQAGSRTVSKWWKPTAAVGTIGTGGALAWRQQDLSQARAIADQQQDYTAAVESIMDSDLPPERKREMVDALNQNAPASGENKNGGNDGGDGGLLGGDLQTTLVLLIVVAFALRYTLGDDD
ncbi:head protein [Haloarcula hispanica virus PH1]|uniref:Capsid protein VP10 n=1 Tax=Haloarcula hispanica virus PH1 TaxID=1282967 RepID=M4JFM0_9VIRU|nr:head protein [Haloarcula hispanica virus PH1]AGC65551.1 capsid protein VP10 [Haloarcula hispanica virus PH1]